ncbi:phosphoribosyltransferase family protein [Actinomadura rayongensis]|uniref:Phosphoribosyltransferase n=1 Tax=Actinomadura rayongensis TaxID=1429076 RepID=A0A6I4WHY5_9ACTN|nr:phosphoribosyltransferase [Actinomadura rayongensis]
MSAPFADRVTAGRELAERLVPRNLEGALVLGLPRGGTPVAAEVARALNGTLDVLVTRKIGVPGQPELAAGAVAEGGEPALDPALLAEAGLTPADLAPVIEAERAELDRRVAAYRGDRPPPEIAGRTVVVVDDGLATGSTARAALRAVRARRPARLVLAVPVGAADTVRALRADADEIVTLAEPVPFFAVGQWYDDFTQTTDAEVVAALRG